MSVLNFKANVFLLPSEGKPYDPAKFNLINGDSVKVRPMTVGDQRYLSGTGGDAYQIYFSMIDRLFVEPKMTNLIDDLLLDDINAMLFIIRIVSFGDEFGLEFSCDTCGHHNKHSLKLSELDFVYASEIEDFDADVVEIEVGGKKLTMHRNRMRDEKIITKQMKNLAKIPGLIQDEGMDRLYVRYAQLIDLIDGEKPPFFKDKMAFIDNLSIQDLEDLAEAVNKQSIGVMPNVKVDCSAGSCGVENEVRVAVSPGFFRPNPRA